MTTAEEHPIEAHDPNGADRIKSRTIGNYVLGINPHQSRKDAREGDVREGEAG